MFIYSLEPPIYKTLNWAIRDKVGYLLDRVGPFAAALGEITSYSDKNRDDCMKEDFTVYRGFSTNQNEIDSFTYILDQIKEQEN